MHKAICSRVLSELSRNRASISVCSYALLPDSSSWLQKQQERCSHANTMVTVEPKQKTYRNALIDISEPRHLPLTATLEKYLPKNFFPRKFEELKVDEAIQYLYEDICDEVDYMKFFEVFDMSDTFNSWFTVMELHIYFLCCRFMKEGPDAGIPIRDSLTNVFWKDVELRAERLGSIAESLRMKSLKILSAQFQAAFYGYDEGIQTNDMILAAVVWRRFFAFECDDALQIERVVKYMRLQLQVLSEDSVDDILYKRRKLFLPLSEVTVS